MKPAASDRRRGRRGLTLGAVVATASLLSIGAAALSGLPSGGEVNQKAYAAPAKKKKAKGDGEVIVLEPFVVALSGSNTSRNVRVRFAIAIDTKQPDEVLAEKLQLRNEFLEVVYGLDVDTLRKKGGFLYLRGALAERAKEKLGSKCGELLLTEFILL